MKYIGKQATAASQERCLMLTYFGKVPGFDLHLLPDVRENGYDRVSYAHFAEENQSVLGRNRCMCCSSHALCYGCMQSCAIHNSFASYDGDVIHACHTNKADCH